MEASSPVCIFYNIINAICVIYRSYLAVSEKAKTCCGLLELSRDLGRSRTVKRRHKDVFVLTFF